MKTEIVSVASAREAPVERWTIVAAQKSTPNSMQTTSTTRSHGSQKLRGRLPCAGAAPFARLARLHDATAAMPMSSTAGRTANCQPNADGDAQADDDRHGHGAQHRDQRRARELDERANAADRRDRGVDMREQEAAAGTHRQGPSQRHSEGGRPCDQGGGQPEDGERSQVDGTAPESDVEAVTDETGADQAHRHRRRVEADLCVRQGERRRQEGTDGAEQVDEVAQRRLVDVGAPHVGEPGGVADGHAPRALERQARRPAGRHGVTENVIRGWHEPDARHGPRRPRVPHGPCLQCSCIDR